LHLGGIFRVDLYVTECALGERVTQEKDWLAVATVVEIAVMPTMACVRIAILIIEFLLVALVQTATAREEQQTSLPHGFLLGTERARC
jgi:hypothetical protein